MEKNVIIIGGVGLARAALMKEINQYQGYCSEEHFETVGHLPNFSNIFPAELVLIFLDSGLLAIDQVAVLKERIPEWTIVVGVFNPGKLMVSVKQLFGMGVAGLIGVHSTIIDLVECLESVSKGGKFLSADLREAYFDDYIKGDIKMTEGKYLTLGEVRVAKLVADGRSTKEISHLLGISGDAVNNRKRKVLKKLGLKKAFEIYKFLK